MNLKRIKYQPGHLMSLYKLIKSSPYNILHGVMIKISPHHPKVWLSDTFTRPLKQPTTGAIVDPRRHLLLPSHLTASVETVHSNRDMCAINDPRVNYLCQYCHCHFPVPTCIYSIYTVSLHSTLINEVD